EHQLRKIRRLFEGQPGWEFRVVFVGSDPLQALAIPTPAPASVRSGVDEVRTLIAQGHRRPAFIVAWSLLEAALRARDGKTNIAHTPGAVIQTLATNGYIEPDVEQRLRALIDVRNRVVHGDLMADPATADIELVLSAIEETLSADAA